MSAPYLQPEQGPPCNPEPLRTGQWVLEFEPSQPAQHRAPHGLHLFR